jgi:hypothetical protein
MPVLAELGYLIASLEALLFMPLAVAAEIMPVMVERRALVEVQALVVPVTITQLVALQEPVELVLQIRVQAAAAVQGLMAMAEMAPRVLLSLLIQPEYLARMVPVGPLLIQVE